MKIYENGKYRDMTSEEIAEMERMMAQMPQPEPDPMEERLSKLEQENAYLTEALEALLSGGD